MTGAEVISELITELDASVDAAAGFEGEMQRLSGYARCAILPMHAHCHTGSFAHLLTCVRFNSSHLAFGAFVAQAAVMPSVQDGGTMCLERM